MFSTVRTGLRLAAGTIGAAALALVLLGSSGFAAGTTPANPGVDPMTTAAVDAPKPSGTVDMKSLLEPQKLEDRVLGPADAKVTVVEYVSMTCPHCRDFTNKSFDAIKKKYVDTGKVRYITRLFPLFSPKDDPRGAAASALVRCVPANQYYPMLSVLYEQWDNWALPTAKDPKGTLVRISKLAGLTQDKFNACLTNQKLVDDIFAERNKAEKDYGVDATPTFFINGQKYEGFMSADEMSAILDKLL